MGVLLATTKLGVSCSHPTIEKAPRLARINAIERRLWLLLFELDEVRARHRSEGRVWRRLGVCILLTMLRGGQ